MAAVAFRDPRLGAVVVATHSREWAVGQVVDLTLPRADAIRPLKCGPRPDDLV